MRIVLSVFSSLLASVIGTFLLRRVLSAVNGDAGGDDGKGKTGPEANVVVVLVPIIVGNSPSNKVQAFPFSFMGWKKRK